MGPTRATNSTAAVTTAASTLTNGDDVIGCMVLFFVCIFSACQSGHSKHSLQKSCLCSMFSIWMASTNPPDIYHWRTDTVVGRLVELSRGLHFGCGWHVRTSLRRDLHKFLYVCYRISTGPSGPTPDQSTVYRWEVYSSLATGTCLPTTLVSFIEFLHINRARTLHLASSP